MTFDRKQETLVGCLTCLAVDGKYVEFVSMPLDVAWLIGCMRDDQQVY